MASSDGADQQGWRYFQYLESSCFQLIQKQFGMNAEDLNQHIQSVIKLHALLGCRIVLNSSSPLELQVAHLFADRDFGAFVSDHPTFLKMSSVYALPGNPTRRDIALASVDFASAGNAASPVLVVAMVGGCFRPCC